MSASLQRPRYQRARRAVKNPGACATMPPFVLSDRTLARRDALVLGAECRFALKRPAGRGFKLNR